MQTLSRLRFLILFLVVALAPLAGLDVYAAKWEAGHDTSTSDDDRYYGSHTTTTAGRWFCVLERWIVEPGLHTITRGTVRQVLAAQIDTSGYWAVIEYDSASNEYTVLAKEAITITATDTEIEGAYTLDLDVLVGENPVYFAWCTHNTSAVSAGRPGCRGVSTAASPTASDNVIEIVLEDSGSGTSDLPDTWDTDSAWAHEELNTGTALSIQWTSSAGVIARVGAYSGTAVGYALPRPVDDRAFYIFRSVVVADSNALTIDFREGQGSEGTAVVDMGATDQITFGGANVALPTIDAIAQAGDNLDIAVAWEPNDGGTDLYWVNLKKGAGGLGLGASDKYRDITTISHESARTSSRGGLVSINAPHAIYISGTATYSELIVVKASELYIALGDSQTGNKNTGQPANLHRLGSALEAQIDGEIWQASVPGSRFDTDAGTSSTAGKTRYDGTIGTHDLKEMVKKSGATLLFCGMGINDIAAGVSDASTAASAPTTYRTALNTILADLGNGTAAIFGLPPYSHSGADEHKAQGVKNWNEQLSAAAVAYSVGFTSPWGYMFAGVINAENEPTFASEYTADAGLHYNDAGAAVAAAALVRSISGDQDEVTHRPRTLFPSVLRTSVLDDAGNIKRSFTSSTYSSGPAYGALLKPGLRDHNDDLKPGLLNADGTLKASLLAP